MSKRKNRKEVHHRYATAIGGTDCPQNTVEVRQDMHAAFHLLFSKVVKGSEKVPMTAQEIVAELNKTWFDYRYNVVLMPKFPSQYEEEQPTDIINF